MTTEFDTLTHATADERTGIAWWNSLGKAARLYWLRQAGSAVPADAWSEYKRTQSRIDWCRNDFPLPLPARPRSTCGKRGADVRPDFQLE